MDNDMKEKLREIIESLSNEQTIYAYTLLRKLFGSPE